MSQTTATDHATLLNVIRSRRSIGKVRPERPPRELIEQMLEAAVCAPNHHLTQPWRFFVIAGEAREQLGNAMAQAELAATEPGRPARDPAKVRQKPLRAPVIIAVAVEPSQDSKVVEIEEIESGAAAVENMLLAAHSLGLAAMWRTGDAAYAPEVKALFGLAPSAHLLGFIYIGYPDVTLPERRRAPATERTTWLGWD